MLASEFPPKNTAGVHRTLRFIRFLPECGWTPIVFTMNVVQAGGNKLLEKLSPDLEVHRVGEREDQTMSAANAPRKATRLQRGVKYFRSWLRPIAQLLMETPDRSIGWSKLLAPAVTDYLRTNPLDALYSSGPPHSVHLAARSVSLATGIPWIADFRDPWARRPWGSAENPLGRKLIPRYERRVVESASLVILNTDACLADFQVAYPSFTGKFRCIPNGLDPELVEEVRSLLCIRTKAHEYPVLCHPGGMYGQRDPSTTLRALAKLNREGFPIKLQQIGAINQRQCPVQLAKDLGIPHLFEAVSGLSHKETLQAMQQADMLLILQPNAPLMVPGKAYEMLAFDHPIVAVCDSHGTEKVVSEAGGLHAPSADENAIANIIRSAWEGRADPVRLQLRQQARSRYDGRELTKNLASTLSEVANQSRRSG